LNYGKLRTQAALAYNIFFPRMGEAEVPKDYF